DSCSLDPRNAQPLRRDADSEAGRARPGRYPVLLRVPRRRHCQRAHHPQRQALLPARRAGSGLLAGRRLYRAHRRRHSQRRPDDKAFGLNTARKHVKVEDPRWYYWCDRLGLLVAQDMPSSHNLSTDEAKQNFVQEWKEILAAVRAHPCVILWITFNENWGDPKEFQDTVVELTRAADPTRPIIDASGWNQRDKTDITDIHDYGNDLRRHCTPNPPRPRWIGEYGGVALP